MPRTRPARRISAIASRRDQYVIVMDWVDGTDLARLVRDTGTPGLPLSSVLEYLAETAEALTFLHTQQVPIIHGDVKPANLILTRGGRVKLVDFGLSSRLGMEDQWRGTADSALQSSKPERRRPGPVMCTP